MRNNYQMEELVPIVGKLAEKYTENESTSITYEKAEQLMGAVLYCIQEIGQSNKHSIAEEIAVGAITAQEAYEIGTMCVREKTKKALEIYNELLPEFHCYGNQCLYDVFVKGLPEFFRWYDVSFEPQNTILTLDYPILKDISEFTGIDLIYDYILCICLEQKFLKCFPEKYVKNILYRYHEEYEDLLENICEIVFWFFIGHILAEKPLTDLDLTEEDCQKIQSICCHTDTHKLKKQLEQITQLFLKRYCENCEDLLEYLQDSINHLVFRLKQAAEQNSLRTVFYPCEA